MSAGPLVLWDVDGTLLSTGGAGRTALAAAFEDLHGVPSAFDGLAFAGRTDDGICRDAYQRAGVHLPHSRFHALRQAYLPRLRRALSQRGPTLAPGVHPALDAVDSLGVNALLTGNWQAGAEVKLSAGGLWHRFALGAFGDDAEDRDDLVPVARARARAAGWRGDQVVVIGDTVHDVQCARAGDALAVAVLTGWGSEAELRQTQPDLLLTDLEQGMGALLALLGAA